MYKNRRSVKKNNSSSSSADWQGLIYYSIIGVLLYIGFMAIRSLSLGTGNKSSFADWFKSIFDIFSAGTGFGDSDQTVKGNDNSGFEDTVDQQGNGQDLYSGTIRDYEYFKANEYFGNYPRPTNGTYIANYDRLMRDLDLIRLNYGSAVKISSGYLASDIAIFKECKGAHIKPSNGNNEALNKVVVALRNSGQLKGSSVYFPDTGETRYYIK
ncbi:hypothetical protein [Epilithonimonas mollis]|uniref:Uncharacterized protein n=1 Tax=Epilithonimonas mollis TaxID=216903 RepID=A0A1M6U256_9FLAO|nr:hypothetical protein [Epilithonimonas mollis]SHK63239.1 hypothetical protein SAMN05444371_3075 [Epilithonimonas mollis]